MAAFKWNRGQAYSRIGGRFGLEYALRAANYYADFHNEYFEVMARFEAAFSLLRSEQFDEARRQTNRVIELLSDFPEKSGKLVAAYDMLYAIEEESGTSESQSRVYEFARSAYKKIRRSSSSAPNELPHVVVPGQALIWQVKKAIQARQHRNRKLAAVSEKLGAILQDHGQSPRLQALASKLIKILDGERNPELATDQALLFQDAVELELMLESLQNRNGKRKNG